MNGLIEYRWHMFQHQAGYPAWAHNLMVEGAAKGLMEDGWGDLADQHWNRGGGGWADMAEPWKWCP